MRLVVLVAITLAARVGSGQAETTRLSCDAIVASSDNGSGTFGSVAQGRGERLAWTDGQPGQFVLRDGAGTIRVVGRQGAGPGEFNRPGYMNWIGDTLWVSDYRLNRIQFFSDTGKLIRVATAMLPGNWGAARDGRLVGFAPVTASMSFPVEVVSHRPTTMRLDTLGTFPVVAVDRLEVPLRGESVFVPQPLGAQTVIGNNADFTRFCAAIPGDGAIRLTCIDDSGHVVLDRPVSLPPRPTSDAVYDSTIAFYLRYPGRTDAMMRSRVARPRHLPLAMGMMVDQRGNVWLLRSHHHESNVRWARLRSDGTSINEIVVPKRMRVLQPEGDSFWAAHADNDGLETLLRCRIP